VDAPLSAALTGLQVTEEEYLELCHEDVKLDRVIKRRAHAAGGALEYWGIEAEQPHAECYRLQPTRQYQLIFSGEPWEYRSVAIPGFWLKVERSK